MTRAGIFRVTRARHIAPLLLISLVLGCVAGMVAPTTRAATLTVTTTTDIIAGSLRQAILAANATAGPDTISFNIPASDSAYNPNTNVWTITPLSALPPITDRVTIDGLSQPGASCDTWPPTLKIELSGTSAGTDAHGLQLTTGASGSVVRGLVINRFSANGIQSVASDIAVACNFLGTDASGTSRLDNRGSGIAIIGGTGSSIGGTRLRQRNLLSGNTGDGVTLRGASRNVVQGNYIGTNVAGTSAIPNRREGISIFENANDNTIGGRAAGAGNLVSGNDADGISLQLGASRNLIQGNAIGTQVDRASPLGNGFNGVSVLDGRGIGIGNQIGGSDSGAGNTIAFNGASGVLITSAQTTTSAIQGNAIFRNAWLGIDLSLILDGDGVTTNDADDADTGPNFFQNHPVLTSATSRRIGGTLASAASTTFRIEVFASTSCGRFGYGEGEVFLGAQSVTTDAGGSGRFTFGYTPVAGKPVITATATDPNGNTSEFSACRRSTAGPVAAADSYSTSQATALHVPAPGVLGNDGDAGDRLTAVLVRKPSNGTLTLNADGSFSYRPRASFVGSDRFTYQANDGQADSNVATVTITVRSRGVVPPLDR